MIQHRIIIGKQNDRFTVHMKVRGGMPSLLNCGVSVEDP